VAKKVAKPKKASSKSKSPKRPSKDDRIAELTSLAVELIKNEKPDKPPVKAVKRRSTTSLAAEAGAGTAAAVSSHGTIVLLINSDGIQRGRIQPEGADDDVRLGFGPKNLAPGVTFASLREFQKVAYDGNPPQNVRPV